MPLKLHKLRNRLEKGRRKGKKRQQSKLSAARAAFVPEEEPAAGKTEEKKEDESIPMETGNLPVDCRVNVEGFYSSL